MYVLFKMIKRLSIEKFEAVVLIVKKFDAVRIISMILMLINLNLFFEVVAFPLL